MVVRRKLSGLILAYYPSFCLKKLNKTIKLCHDKVQCHRNTSLDHKWYTNLFQQFFILHCYTNIITKLQRHTLFGDHTTCILQLNFEEFHWCGNDYLTQACQSTSSHLSSQWQPSTNSKKSCQVYNGRTTQKVKNLQTQKRKILDTDCKLGVY